MAADRPTGEVGNLTADEEIKLQQAWAHLIRLCHGASTERTGGAWDKTPDKTSVFLPTLSSVPTEDFRKDLWKMILLEHPDSVVLRFLRARKWDVEKALQMLLSDVNWRREAKIEDVIRIGESVALKESTDKVDEGFLTQWRSGKSYVRGVDKEGRPVYVVRAKLHDPNAQTTEAMQRFILHNIEGIRLLVKPPNDKACFFFDMDGFGLRNMDFEVARFMVQIFESKYPETLGGVIVHNAPFVFWGLWKIVRGWMDPVVVSKINFTKSKADIEQFIDKENLQATYGGTDNWEYKYIEPQDGDDHRLERHDEKNEIQKQHDALVAEFESLTADWLSHDPETPEAKNLDSKRHEAAERLRVNYWKLDPYIRAVTYYHRAGLIDGNGNVDFKGAT